MRDGRSFFAVVVAVVLLSGMVAFHHFAQVRRGRFPAEQDALYLPRSDALKMLSLGHQELAADLVFVRAIVYFGSQFAGERKYQWLQNYLSTIVELDPRWKTPYRWAGVATIYDGRKVTNESVNASSHFLEMGTRQFPSDWELPFMLGCNYLFELHTDDRALRSKWRHQGAEWIRHAALVGGAPPWVPGLAAKIYREEGRDEAALHHLEEVYLTTQDEKTRQEVKNLLVAAHAKVDFVRSERERDLFQTAWKNSLPYVPADFFTVVRMGMSDQPSQRLDLKHLSENLFGWQEEAE